MTTETALAPRTARRLALVLATAGIAALGSVALAPAASAEEVAQDGPAFVVEGNGKGGPDFFIVTENGRTPIFFFDAEKPNKHHNKCLVLDGPRF